MSLRMLISQSVSLSIHLCIHQYILPCGSLSIHTVKQYCLGIKILESQTGMQSVDGTMSAFFSFMHKSTLNYKAFHLSMSSSECMYTGLACFLMRSWVFLCFVLVFGTAEGGICIWKINKHKLDLSYFPFLEHFYVLNKGNSKLGYVLLSYL